MANNDGMGRQVHLGEYSSIVFGRYGLYYVNRYDEYVGRALSQYGEYCEAEWNCLSQFILPGNVIVEVGANIGAHTVSIARCVGPRGRVIAIEPQRVIHQYLCANIALNLLGNVETHWAGCGIELGRMVVPPVDYFTSTPQNFGGISLRPEGDGEAVAILRLDDIMRDRKAALIKIDVEGMEADVIRGAFALIGKSRPVLYLENDRVEKSDALISLLWSLEYRTYWHTPRFFNPDNFFGCRENRYGDMGSINMLCLPRESSWSVQGFPEATDLNFHPLRRRD